jgi:hypothetical protein
MPKRFVDADKLSCFNANPFINSLSVVKFAKSIKVPF